VSVLSLDNADDASHLKLDVYQHKGSTLMMIGSFARQYVETLWKAVDVLMQKEHTLNISDSQ
jgi:hypothetical protein